MIKIISLFQRNYEGDRLVRDEVVPGAEWVVNGEGVATRKWDGTCCMIRDGELYKRYDAKHGKQPPEGFIPAQPLPDENTGHWPGWLKVSPDLPADQYHREAFLTLLNRATALRPVQDGTYELCGPKIQGNPERLDRHILIPHGKELLDHAGFVPRDFHGVKAYLSQGYIEGIVWHHPDGRMVKIKAKDFGIKRK